MKVKNISDAKENYKDSASIVQKRYERGISDADWATNAGSSESEELYQQKLRESFTRNARQNGIRKVGNDEWKKRAMEKGAPNIAPGMRNSVDKWQKNTQPYFDELASLNLEPKVADVEQNVMNRVLPIAKALHARKLREQGSS